VILSGLWVRKTFNHKGRRGSQRNTRTLFCEYARTLARTFPSHDWHVQPSCQRPNRIIRLSGRAFSPVESLLHERGRSRLHGFGCPRNLLKLLVLLRACQPIAPTGFPPVFHIGSPAGEAHFRAAKMAALQAQQNTSSTHAFGLRAAGSSVRFGASTATAFYGQSRAEDSG
jgi:hypothetical protein